jgi:competence protein ComEC
MSVVSADSVKIAAIVIPALLAFIFLIFRRKVVFGGLFALALGAFFFYIFSALAAPILPAGCSEVKIASDIALRGTRLEFAVQNSVGQRAVVSTLEDDGLGYGDHLKICFAKSNIEAAGSYSHFLKSQYRTDYSVNSPQIDFLSRGHGLIRWLYDLNDTLSAAARRLWTGDVGELGRGLLLGGKQGFTKEFIDSLQKSGTTHLVAVSGYNVSIIIIVLFGYVRSAFSRRAAIASTVVVLIGFVLLTGATASVLRAGLMGLIFLIGKMLGRRAALVNSLFVAAFLMLLYNPFTIWDVGFQLSFAATFGLVMFDEPVTFLLRNIVNPYGKEILNIFAATLAAQVFTLPIILSAFGRVSLIAPLTNLLVLPLVPLSMGFIALALGSYFIYHVLGLFFASLAEVFLLYFINIIRFFGNLRFSAASIQSVSIWEVLFLYAVIITATITIRALSRQKLLKEAEIEEKY